MEDQLMNILQDMMDAHDKFESLQEYRNTVKWTT